MDLTVAVTGANGFVGRVVCDQLTAAGFTVRAVVRRPCPSLPTHRLHQAVTHDIGPETDWGEILEGVHIVIHLAAVAHRVDEFDGDSFDEYFRVNEHGTRRLATAVFQSNTIRRLVLVSSIGAVTSASAVPLDETSVCAPDTIYGKSKYLAERAVIEVLGKGESDYCIVRPPLMYGPGNPGNMLRLLRLARSGIPLPFARIRNRRSFLFVGNLADALVRCGTAPQASRRVFHVRDGEDVSTPGLIRMIGLATGQKVRLWPMPLSMLRVIGRVGDGIERSWKRRLPFDSYSVRRLMDSLAVDDRQLRECLDWTPPFSMMEALEQTFGTRKTA